MDSILIVRKCALAEVVDAPNFTQLAAEYAAESAMVGMPSPTTKRELYRQLEAAGALQSFGAFLGDMPVGFIGVLHHVIPHYGVGVAISESFFVQQAYRGTGAGDKLLKLAEAHAKELGSPGLLVTAKYASAAELWLNKKRDYEPASMSYFKRFI